MNTAVSTQPLTRTALDGVAESFHTLCASANPPAIDGMAFGAPLPQRLVCLDELKDVLLSAATPAATRDAVWAELIRRARTLGPEWTIGTAGVAMPALLGTLKQFRRDFPNTDTEDLAAEVLTGFLNALKTMDIDRPGIMTRIGWAVYRSARRCAYSEANSVRAAKAAASATPKPDFARRPGGGQGCHRGRGISVRSGSDRHHSAGRPVASEPEHRDRPHGIAGQLADPLVSAGDQTRLRHVTQCHPQVAFQAGPVPRV